MQRQQIQQEGIQMQFSNQVGLIDLRSRRNARGHTLPSELSYRATIIQNKIKLNMNKIPADFFPKTKVKRINSNTESFPSNEFNQFNLISRTLDVRENVENNDHRQVPFFNAGQINKIDHSRPKREYTSQQRKRVQPHQICGPNCTNDCPDIFNCTFAKNMYTQEKRIRNHENDPHSELKIVCCEPKEPKGTKMKVMRSEPQTIILKEELEVASERYLQTKGSKRKNRNSFIGQKINTEVEINKKQELQQILNRKMLREVDIDRDVRPRNRTRKVKLPHIESARRAQ